jgi:hypothetical protein
MEAFIRQLFSDPQLLRMGHDQREGDLNLGLGWLYYSLGRMLRPRLAVVIGSYRGFVPAVMAKGLLDNVEGGELLFIDPSLADDFWTDPAAVTQRFAELGTPNVRHARHTTQSFVTTPEYAALADVGLLMVDGFHSAEQARFDYLAFLPKLGPQAMVLFHDSVKRRRSTFYGQEKAYEHTVCDFMQCLRETPGLDVMDFPLGGGLTLVRGQPQTLRFIEAPFATKACVDGVAA